MGVGGVKRGVGRLWEGSDNGMHRILSPLEAASLLTSDLGQQHYWCWSKETHSRVGGLKMRKGKEYLPLDTACAFLARLHQQGRQVGLGQKTSCGSPAFSSSLPIKHAILPFQLVSLPAHYAFPLLIKGDNF